MNRARGFIVLFLSAFFWWQNATAQNVNLINSELNFDNVVFHLSKASLKGWEFSGAEGDVLIWNAPNRPAVLLDGGSAITQTAEIANLRSALPGQAEWKLILAVDVLGKSANTERLPQFTMKITDSESGEILARDKFQIAQDATLSKEFISRVYASSFKRNSGEPKFALDGDQNTIWHSDWGKNEPAHPHHLMLDLGKNAVVRGFTYVPRKDGGNGTVGRFELQISDNAVDWRSVKSGTFRYQKPGQPQIINLDQAVRSRFLKLNCLSSHRGDKFASCAEFIPDVEGGFQFGGDSSSDLPESVDRKFVVVKTLKPSVNNVNVELGVSGESGVVIDHVHMFFAPEFATRKMLGKANGHAGPDLLGAGSYGFQGLMIHQYPALPIMEVIKGSPAELAGLQRTDLIVGINDRFLPEGNLNPSFSWGITSHEALLGRAAAQAFASSSIDPGVVKLMVLRDLELIDVEIDLNLPGEIGNLDFLTNKSTSPILNQDIINRVVSSQLKDGSWKRNPVHTSLGGLALLSTQEEKYAPHIKACANWLMSRNAEPGTGFYWHPAFAGMFLAEYYLATGDERTIPVMERMLRMMSSAYHTSKWGTETFGHGPRGLPYGNKSLVAVMVHVILFEELAKRCGIESDIYETLIPYLESAWSDPQQGGHGALGYNASYKDLGEFWSRTGIFSLALLLKDVRADMRKAMSEIMYRRHPWFRNSHAYGEPGGLLGWIALSQVRPDYFREAINEYRWWFALAWERGEGLHFTIPHMGAPYMEGPELINNGYGIVLNAHLKSLHMTGSKKRNWLDVSEIEIPVTDVMILQDSKDRISLRCRIPGPDIFFTVDGSEPTSNSPRFTKPFRIRPGTTLKAVAYTGAGKSRVSEREFGLNKRTWSIVSASGNKDSEKARVRAKNAIDGDTLIPWVTDIGESADGFPHELVIDLGSAQRPSRLTIGNLFKEASASNIRVERSRTRKSGFEKLAVFETNKYLPQFEIPLESTEKFRYLRIVFEKSLSGSPSAVLMVGELELK